MKKILFAMVLAGALSSSIWAALPPLGQSAREVEAIVSSRELDKFKPADAIHLVKRIQNNKYIIVTDTQMMTVEVVYDTSSSQQNVGPRKFSLVFSEPTIREDKYHEDKYHEDRYHHRKY